MTPLMTVTVYVTDILTRIEYCDVDCLIFAVTLREIRGLPPSMLPDDSEAMFNPGRERSLTVKTATLGKRLVTTQVRLEILH